MRGPKTEVETAGEHTETADAFAIAKLRFQIASDHGNQLTSPVNAEKANIAFRNSV